MRFRTFAGNRPMTDQAEKASPFPGFPVTKRHKPESAHLTISPVSQLEGVSTISGEFISFINVKGTRAVLILLIQLGQTYGSGGEGIYVQQFWKGGQFACPMASNSCRLKAYISFGR